MVSVSGIDIKFGRILGAILLIVVLVLLYKHYGSGNSNKIAPKSDVAAATTKTSSVGLDLKDMTEIKINVVGNECQISYIRRTPDKLDETKPRVVLLHGAKYSASTWAEIGTLDKLKEWGYDTIAFTIPPAEMEKCAAASSEGYAALLDKAIVKSSFPMSPGLVIVSPSLSGKMSLPYVLDSNYQKHVSAYIPIAPVMDSSNDNKERYKTLQLKTMILVGRNDASGKTVSGILNNIPDNKLYEVPDAGHPCYKDNPTFWHEKLQTFLQSLSPPTKKTETDQPKS